MTSEGRDRARCHRARDGARPTGWHRRDGTPPAPRPRRRAPRGNRRGECDARAEALGYDLERPHRVVVVEAGPDTADRTKLFHAVRRAARDAGSEQCSSAVARPSSCSPTPSGHGKCSARPSCANWVAADAGSESAAGASAPPTSLDPTRGDAGAAGAGASPEDRTATAFDELGVYRLFAGVEDLDGVERFAQGWLGDLIEYDAKKGAPNSSPPWVSTSTVAATTTPPPRRSSVHRSTLKYRLQRIREISGHDLGSPETQFNLQLAVHAWRTVRAVRGESAVSLGIPAHRSARCVTECVVDRGIRVTQSRFASSVALRASGMSPSGRRSRLGPMATPRFVPPASAVLPPRRTDFGGIPPARRSPLRPGAGRRPRGPQGSAFRARTPATRCCSRTSPRSTSCSSWSSDGRTPSGRSPSSPCDAPAPSVGPRSSRISRSPGPRWRTMGRACRLHPLAGSSPGRHRPRPGSPSAPGRRRHPRRRAPARCRSRRRRQLAGDATPARGGRPRDHVMVRPHDERNIRLRRSRTTPDTNPRNARIREHGSGHTSPSGTGSACRIASVTCSGGCVPSTVVRMPRRR